MTPRPAGAHSGGPPMITDGVGEDPVARGCRALWSSVLIWGVREELAEPRGGDPRTVRAKGWTGWVGTRDFREVCALAGLDPEYVRRKVEAIRDAA